MTAISLMGCIYLVRTPLVDLVECLGVEGTLGVIPLTEIGLGASVELIGSVDFPTLLPLSLVAGGVTLSIGVTGNNDSIFNRLKESEECELNLILYMVAFL